MRRLFRRGSSALLSATILALPMVAHAQPHTARRAQQPAALDIRSTNAYFSGIIAVGPDAGQRVQGLLSLASGAGTLTLGDGSQASASAGPVATGITMTLTLPNGAIKGTVTSANKAVITGTFSGPHAGDTGFWTADGAVTTLSYAINGAVTKGPDHSRSALIGDMLAYVTADGTVFGTYTDNSLNAPGHVAPVYPIRGFYVGGLFTGTITYNARTTFALVGRSGQYYGQSRLAGSLLGPRVGDTGSWAGAAQ